MSEPSCADEVLPTEKRKTSSKIRSKITAPSGFTITASSGAIHKKDDQEPFADSNGEQMGAIKICDLFHRGGVAGNGIKRGPLWSQRHTEATGFENLLVPRPVGRENWMKPVSRQVVRKMPCQSYQTGRSSEASARSAKSSGNHRVPGTTKAPGHILFPIGALPVLSQAGS
ncbi:hypothetical protein JM93_04104 [Roseibium hamelinense]|uniref:Uncharacterized protein n=1 Tax=Roseibium hamelinense TaxID=150831 RepID=A0A562SFD5_9HYPH|nr:hypothetical protein JM93_04104 [Roseibium hamelinense]